MILPNLPNLRKLSVINIALILALLVLIAFAFSLFQANANAEQEKTRLEIRAKAAELNFNALDKETNIESLRQSLEEIKSAPAENPLPTKAEAIATTDQIKQYAEENNVRIVKWQSGYTEISLKAKKYPAIKYSLNTEGEAFALVGFIKALTQASVAPIVQKMDIKGVKGSELMWQMRLELVVYYR